MKVLVTGGAGYIGSHTARKLRDAGCVVVIDDHRSNGFRFNHAAAVVRRCLQQGRARRFQFFRPAWMRALA